MRIALIVMADVMVLVVALLAVTEYRALRRYSSFTVPFTDRLIACGAMAASARERVLREDRTAHIVGIALCVAVWLMLTVFFAGVSAALTFPVGAALLLAALKAEDGETPENREQYYRAHKKDIDDVKYHACVAQSEAGPSGGEM